MSIRLVTAPDSAPVTLDEAKRFLKVDGSANDDIIKGLLVTATLQAQSDVQRLYVTQTVEWVTDSWKPVMRLPIAPVLAGGLVSIKYVDQYEVQQTLDASQYVVRQEGPTLSIAPAYWTIWPILSVRPANEPIVIRFTAGNDIADVPENVKTAIKFYLRHYWSMAERSMFATLDWIEGVARQEYSVSQINLGAIADLCQNLLADQRWN
jgi:uncharacterized phiE125 gp8 family phage protein